MLLIRENVFKKYNHLQCTGPIASIICISLVRQTANPWESIHMKSTQPQYLYALYLEVEWMVQHIIQITIGKKNSWILFAC